MGNRSPGEPPSGSWGQWQEGAGGTCDTVLSRETMDTPSQDQAPVLSLLIMLLSGLSQWHHQSVMRERLRESAGSVQGGRGLGWAGLCLSCCLFILATGRSGSGPKWSTSSCICNCFLLPGLEGVQLINDCKILANIYQEVSLTRSLSGSWLPSQRHSLLIREEGGQCLL